MHLKRKPAKTPAAPASDSSTIGRAFNAVSIRHSTAACQAANDCAGERWLCREAPLLPLGHCDRVQDCDCRYQRFDDRRVGPRRRDEGALSFGSVPEFREARVRPGKRQSDEPTHTPAVNEPESLVADTYYGYVQRPKDK